MRSPVVDLFADLAAALDGPGVPWYLFGAQAAIIHGAARLTADVDVTIQLPAVMSSGALVQALEERGFQRPIADPGFIERTRVMSLVHVATALPLDLVIAGPGLEEQFFERAQTREIDGVPVRVASAEDVVVMKVLAGRPKALDRWTREVVAWRFDPSTGTPFWFPFVTVEFLFRARSWHMA